MNDLLIQAMKNEITEHHIYKKLATTVKDSGNKTTLEKIASDEYKHYSLLKKQLGIDVTPSSFRIFKYYWIAKIFGLTFGVKLMERGEAMAAINYKHLTAEFDYLRVLAEDEEIHEKMLINMISEDRLKYVSSVVLGLSDALVELTGALAGFTLALQNTRLIATVGLITGISASLSMASSEYMSSKHEEGEADGKDPIKSAVYTGSAYVIVVFLLILPFLLMSKAILALAISLSTAVAVIFGFTYYVSVAQDKPLWPQFFEMAGVSLVVSFFSFFLGYLIRHFFGIDV
ncbi:MAG: rubrerythrin family protein [Bdellovibrionales bacterium RIFOXYD12_FULL_39_22]|nr:MAG: rubrerythrin family protein [Bdellovibrionales bacterium RIFOXYB1_FULL_39_21]OFZ41891.1 MAG: rubrerythrin family protein [Bdellovibrionales bacterium RIFOXYC12_FULL_39_17]OFZ50607.1 MAG: rubrerythrin family protein [Bdellovibrionales bacterium RIFOXYC1_FULL_39_130]OFZ77830.1 MAG: rubrerythrin family protein [Bdellovibrionales bacterium RIFOXYD1_FULL_39_84]OFZ93734.1 MAG: rubrerythrin family protein [Bdellovibrionales bacterium RIFOXYD12_FULL_39_22]HLE11581.1 VIT1/CCC1 transporter famil